MPFVNFDTRAYGTVTNGKEARLLVVVAWV
jgi:hypothetical protein